MLALAVAGALLSAAPSARAQWNEEKQAEREREEAKAREKERERKRLDPEDPIAIATRTAAMNVESLGLRAGAVDSRSGETATGFALAVAAQDDFDGAVNRRVRLDARVGESDGVEGSVRADAAIGYRFDLDPWYGFPVRGGVRGRLYGNDRIALSALEAPQIQAGFQFLRTMGAPAGAPLGPFGLLELAGRASAGLVARAEVDTAARHLKPTPAVGGHFAMEVDATNFKLSFNVEYTHFLPNGASSEPIDDGAASLCAARGLVSICGNGESTWTSVLSPVDGERRERILMYGLTLSISLDALLRRSKW